MTRFKSEFLTIMQDRGFLHQHTDLEALDARLVAGPITGYLGCDATAPSLHVGNLMGIMALYWFQATGNRAITLVGGATTRVADPSGKDEMRKLLDPTVVDKNITSISGVFAKFLRYGDGKLDSIMLDNYDWWRDVNYLDLLCRIGPHFSVNRMLTMDSVKLRLEREQPLSFLEFNYMILQGYDYVHLYDAHNITLQFGGADQWGNIISGVDLVRRMRGVEVSALTWGLLTTPNGKKMGKSAGGAVWLNADMLSPYDYYQFWRNTHDGDVGRFLKIFTTLPMDEIAKLAALKDAEVNEAKKILAFEATKLCHGEDAARTAAQTAQATFEAGGAGDDLPTHNITSHQLTAGMPLADIYLTLGLAESKGAFRRLVEGGGVRVNDEPVTDPARVLTPHDAQDGIIKLSAGKKRHGVVKIGENI